MNLEYLQLQELLGGGGGGDKFSVQNIYSYCICICGICVLSKPNYQIIKLLHHVINELSAD